MGKINNFKNLMAEQEATHGEPSEKVKSGIDHTVGFATFSGNIVETFFSTIFGVFISMSGGDSDSSCFRKNGTDRMSESETPDQGFNGPTGKP